MVCKTFWVETLGSNNHNNNEISYFVRSFFTFFTLHPYKSLSTEGTYQNNQRDDSPLQVATHKNECQSIVRLSSTNFLLKIAVQTPFLNTDYDFVTDIVGNS
jgi:hypothetical protein